MATADRTTSTPTVQSLPPDPYADDPWSWTFVLFRPLRDFPGYGVDTDGGIWTYHIAGNTTGKIGPCWRKLKVHPDWKGYIAVSLHRDKKYHFCKVHRLVLTTFMGACPPGMQACHNNGNRSQNFLWNLRWDTAVANQKDKLKHGTKPFGVRSGTAKLSDGDIPEIKQLLADGMTQTNIAIRYGVHRRTVQRVADGWTWRHIHVEATHE